MTFLNTSKFKNNTLFHEAKENMLSGSDEGIYLPLWCPEIILNVKAINELIQLDAKGKMMLLGFVMYDFVPKSPANIRDPVVITVVRFCQWK